MKRFFSVFICLGLAFIMCAVKAGAQHFISIQSGDKQPFTIQVEGSSFVSSKAGMLRLSNLSPGSYTLSITPGKKGAAQTFTASVDKADLSYTLLNQGKKGWVLKNVKGTDVIVSSTPVNNPAQPVVAAKLNSPFALMLSEVINDPSLLDPTPWVLSNKADGSEQADMAAVMNEQQQQDTSTYVAETKGVIKASEKAVNGGTELVFVDFNAYSGDTIHVIIPAAEGNNETAAAQIQQPVTKDTAAIAKTDSAAVQQQLTANDDVPKKDTAAAVAAKPKEQEEQPFDTSGNKQMSNPFFAKESKDSVAANTVTNTNTSTPATQPAEDSAKINAAKETANVSSPSAAEVVKVNVKTDCKKMLTDNDQEKLKHRIYLETDHEKILALTRKALSGKCVSTAQVKELASFFLSDDTRYSFFFTVYPFVYDQGNFGTLEPYMIDRKYKNMFEAMLK